MIQNDGGKGDSSLPNWASGTPSCRAKPTPLGSSADGKAAPLPSLASSSTSSSSQIEESLGKTPTLLGKTEVSRELDRVKNLMAARKGDYNANCGAGMQLEPNW